MSPIVVSCRSIFIILLFRNRKNKLASLKNCSFKDFKSKIRKCIDTNYTKHKLYSYMYTSLQGASRDSSISIGTL